MRSDLKKLTEAEWSVMECLWEHSPATGREITEKLEQKEGWNRSTTLTLLSRLEGKGAVTTGNEGGKKTFVELCEVAGIKTPFEDGALKEIALATENWLNEQK